MQLNQQQSKLLIDLTNFMADDKSSIPFVLSGQAGVGKTTCIVTFAKLLLTVNPGLKICLAGPTNKSVKVLKDSTKMDCDYKTIYSILGLRMMANGEFKELKDGGQCRIGDYDLVVVDEGSLLNTYILDYAEKKTKLSHTKIIYIGDKEQLPPVGELVSPIWTRYKINYELTEVMRHQNSILTFVQSIRANPSPVFESTGSEVKIVRDDVFMKAIAMYAGKGLFHNGKAKAIAWRNITVEWLNDFIRKNFAKTNSDQKFVEGDRIVIKEPIVEGDVTLAATDDEGDILSVNIANHKKYPNLLAWHLTVQLDSGEVISVYTIHEKSESMFEKLKEDLKTKKMWKEFWKLVEAFHNISYAYALTAHRSQGSTFEYVFVDAGDILLNYNVQERTKCLYVASSRASKQLVVLP